MTAAESAKILVNGLKDAGISLIATLPDINLVRFVARS